MGSNQGQGATSSIGGKRCDRQNHHWFVAAQVYDVTEFGRQHPGGNVIYKFAGRDATDVFSAFHSPAAWSTLRTCIVGTVAEGQVRGVFHTQQHTSSLQQHPIQQAETTPVVADFRALRSELMREGMFRASGIYYTFKTASTLAIFIASYALLWMYPSMPLVVALSAAGVGLGLQQAGWLSHDFLHNQVFSARKLNLFAGYMLGNVLQGFSVYWWRNKHNTHHAVPNEIGDAGDAHDPDIDTLPYLAWSKEQLDAARARNDPMLHLVRYQHHLLWPLLCFARMTWAEQSIEAAWQYATTGSWAGWLEVCLLALHYVMQLYVPFKVLPLWGVLCWALLVQVVGGLMLGYVFVQSHNGMEVYADDKDFASAQLVSTRNVAPGLWNDWFTGVMNVCFWMFDSGWVIKGNNCATHITSLAYTGGLNYQIEHHLFPSMPRHNLGKISARVQALCKKHDLPYECVGMTQAIRLVVGHLRAIAKFA